VPDTTSLNSIDQLIVDLGGAHAGTQSKGPCGLLLEHLRSARTSFLGSMAGEYKSSLQEAQESVACIADKNTQADVRKRLQYLIGA
jgi:hypothetical protein